MKYKSSFIFIVFFSFFFGIIISFLNNNINLSQEIKEIPNKNSANINNITNMENETNAERNNSNNNEKDKMINDNERRK